MRALRNLHKYSRLTPSEFESAIFLGAPIRFDNILRVSMRGYTLFELLVVLTIIAFAVLLTPALTNKLRPELQMQNVAHELEGALHLTRSRAVTTGAPVVLTVVVEDKWLLLQETDRNDRWIAAPGWVKVTVGDRNPADGGEHGVIFYPDGSSSGFDIRLSGKKSAWRVTTSLNGKTAVKKEPA